MEAYRDIGDVAAARQSIWDAAMEAASSIEPVSNSRYTLALEDLRWQGPDVLPKSAHKKALLNNSYLTRKLSGTWVLKDNASGKPVSKRRSVVAHIPYLTDMGTFVRGGNDYTLSHQLRLKPGVYTRWTNNGELEAHVNVSGGLGSKLFLDPASGVFKMRMGQAAIPAIDVLRIMGTSEEKIRSVWGDRLYRENIAKEDPKALNKLYDKLTYNRGGAQTPEEKKLAIQAAIMKMGIDPKVSEVTLGKPYDHVNADVILDTTAKLLRINKGEQETDSRDDMAFQRLYGPEDIIADRIRQGQRIMRQWLWKLTHDGAADRIPSGLFDKSVDGALISSGLGQPLEAINPLELFDSQFRVTRLGEGGIASIDAIPSSARNVHPSQMGLIDPIRTPESLKAGIDTRLTGNLRKGKDGQMYTRMLDMAGRPQWVSATDMARSTVAFPNAFDGGDRYVPAIEGGHMRMVPRETVKYIYPNMQSALHPTGRMVPLTSNVKGQRAVMAARMLTQALPLEDGEAPYVQSGIPEEEDRSYEELYGEKFGAMRASVAGQVVNVTPEYITIRDRAGNINKMELYKDLVFNRKTGMTQTAVVRPGDMVKPGDLLARSNFTDEKGTTAVGKNTRIAFLPFRGLNYEDAFVVSESYAKKMTSEHYYKNALAVNDDTSVSLQKFLSMKPGTYTKDQTANFTEDGVIKPGTVVKTGDPLILAMTKVDPTEAQKKLGRKSHWRDMSVTWDHHDDGIVTDVYHDDKGVQVVVKSKQPLQVADKLSGRYGNKGVVAAIIPDDELPSLPDGSKPELLVSPLAIVGRVNPGFVLETLLGKVAHKTGRRYAVKDFGGTTDDMASFVAQELEKHGLKDTEDLYDDSDPEHPKVIPSVLNGYSYFMKLHHSAESKAQGRGLGSYTTDMQPSKGGEDGAKRIGMLELSALLSHGAVRNIADLKYVKGQENMDYWRQYISGYNPPTPRVPYVYDKFVNYLKGAGINVVRNGPRLNVMAMTAKDVDQLTGDRELTGVKSPRTGLQTLPTVAWDQNLKVLPGGLFDPDLTGGHSGNKWSFIRLDQKYPNPVMEHPLRLMLGLTEKEFRGVLEGTHKLDTGTGPEALFKAAQSLNIDNEIIRARNEIRSGKRTLRDAAVKRMGYLKSAQKLGQSPEDWFMDKVPVLPPAFRPVSQMDSDRPLVPDANYLYKALFEANQAYRYNRRVFGDSESGELGLGVYDAFKAVTGLGEPTTAELQQKEVKGLLKSVFGSGPKYSMMHTRLLGTPVDMAGRGVIIPDPDLDMDSIAIPESLAWDSYRPFVVRALRRHGRSGIQAINEVDQKTPAARKLLQEIMESRPVLLNRAPTLHKYGIMAMKPRLTTGDAIKITPFICRGMGADFDGNCVDPDTRISLRVSKSALDRLAGYEHTLRSVDNVDFTEGEYFMVTLPIRSVPHEETFSVDKNGARVYDVPEGVEVISCDPATGISGFYPVTGLTIEEDCQVQEVTAAGRKVIVSGNESLVCFDPETGGLRKATPAEAMTGLIPVFRKDPTPFGTFGDRDFGWWVGAFLSDGHLSANTLGYTKLETAKRMEFIRITRALHANFTLHEYSESAGERRLGSSTKIHMTSKSLAAFINKWDFYVPGEERAALRKQIPSEMLEQGSEEFLWGLLSGLLDGDGTLAVNTSAKNPRRVARFATSSPYLRDGVLELCYRLGIRFSVTVTPPRGHSKESYTVCFSVLDMESNREHLSVIGAAEQQALSVWSELPAPRETADLIPVSEQEWPILRSLCAPSGSKLYDALARKKAVGRACIRELFLPHLDLLKEHLPSVYTRVANIDTIWCPVTEVKDLDRRTVYDLIVPGSKVFCANLGVIVQDTMVFHVPTTDEAAKEALEKMLPSKNLLSAGDFEALPTITKEHLIGLYESTRPRPGRAVRTFRTAADVAAAYARGEILPHEKVRVLE